MRHLFYYYEEHMFSIYYKENSGRYLLSLITISIDIVSLKRY